MTSPAKVSILKLMGKVLDKQFAGESWDGWRVILKAMFALPFEDGELETFEKLTGRTSAPTEAAREVWAICGRRAGKSRPPTTSPIGTKPSRLRCMALPLSRL